jgi:hypothetical protein
MSSADVRIVPYAPPWYPGYRALAEREWGPGCHQADPRFLRWAEANPIASPAEHGTGHGPLWLAVDGERVVGCIHAMRLLWQIGDVQLELPSLHDWLVDPDYRTGVGSMLLTNALRGERHAFIPAAAGELEQIYRALRCEAADPMWFYQPLRPTAGALRFGLGRALGERARALPGPRLRRPAPGRIGEFELSVGADPSLQAALLERLAAAPAPTAGAFPRWTPASFAWRFFAADGPWHLVLAERRGARVASFCLLSVGVRQGLAIGRWMLGSFDDFAGFDRLAAAAARALTELGVHVLLGFTLDPRERVAFARTGWRTRPGPPSFFYHFPRKHRFGVVAAGAAIADFGFESIVTRELLGP